MLRELATDELADWFAYCELTPVEEDRADMRQEVFRQRLLGAFNGTDSSLWPEWNWPYVSAEPSIEEMRAAAEETARKVAEKEKWHSQ